MKKKNLLFLLAAHILLLTGCSSIIFLSASQRLEKEADSMMAADRTSEALLAYHQAIQADSSNHSAARKLIPLYQKQRRMREAERLFNSLSGQEQSEMQIGNPETLPKESVSLKFDWIVTPILDMPVGLAADAEKAVVSYKPGQVILLHLSDGTTIWSKALGKTITAPPSLSPEAILVGCDSGEVVALDQANGNPLWTTKLSGSIYARPLVDQGRVFIGSYDGKMTSLDLHTGKVIWQIDAGNPILNLPVLEKDILYFGTTGGTVFSVVPDTGAALWEKPARLSGSLEAQPVVAGNLLLVASNDSRITALDLNGKAYYWQYSTPDSLYASPLVVKDRVYIFSIGQVAAALDLMSGKEIWKQDLPDPVRSTPVLAGEKLYFAGVSQPYLFEMDAASGQITDKLNTGDWIEAGPILVGKNLLLAGKDGAVISYRLN